MKKSVFIIPLVCQLALWVSPAAQGKPDPRQQKEYFQLASSNVKLLAVEELNKDALQNLDLGDDGSGIGSAGGVPPIDRSLVVIDRIINLGKKIWAIVEAGKPVVNIKTDVASALPQGISHWAQLDNWMVPKSYLYKMTYKNKLGMEVVTFNYRIVQTYGGSVDGVGKYLARVTVIPDHVKVAWGYTLNSIASVPTVMNVGTSEAPIGAAELQLDWEIKTTVQHTRDTEVYYLDGLGTMTHLSAKSRKY